MKSSLQRLAAFLRASIDSYLLLVLLLSLPALAPLFAPGYFYEAHDGRHSVFYQVMFDASLRNGALIPRWAMHHLQGYGYPTFVILAPLGFYIGEIFVLLGAGFTLAARLSFALSVLVSGWGMYALLNHWLQAPPRQRESLDPLRMVAVAGALLYVFAPYRLLDIYVRGALNESLLFMWLPWLFLVWDKLLIGGMQHGWMGRLALAMLALAATWLTHTFAIFCITPLIIAYIIFRGWQLRRGAPRVGNAPTDHEVGWGGVLRRIALAAAGGIGALLLIAYFLLPLLAENPYLNQQVFVGDTYNFRNHFVQIGQYFSPFWGFGYSDDPVGANDGMGFQVGVIALVLGLASALVMRRSRRRGLIIFMALATLVVMLGISPLGAPVWEALPILAVMQFPWRLLLLISFTVCVLAALTLAELLSRNHLPGLLPARSGDAAGMLVFAALAIVAVAGYATPALQPVAPWREDGRAVYRFEEQFPDMITGTIWTSVPFATSPMSADYASDAYVEHNGRTDALTRFSIVAGEGEVLRNHSAGSRFEGTVAMDSAGTLRVNLLYFPGWQVRVNGSVVTPTISAPIGLMEIALEAGSHEIEVVMGSTPSRQWGGWLSVSALLLLAALLLADLRQRRRTRHNAARKVGTVEARATPEAQHSISVR